MDSERFRRIDCAYRNEARLLLGLVLLVLLLALPRLVGF